MIKVIQPGLHSSFQDLGRYGHRASGVPLSGAMDRYHAQLANQILGNSNSMPVLEIMLQGPVLEFQDFTEIAISGADFLVTLNNKAINRNQIIQIKPGDTLTWKAAKTGVFSYLAVRGGFDLQKVLNSCAYHPDIHPTAKLKKGDFLSINKSSQSRKLNASVANNESIFNSFEIEVFPHVEFESLDENQKKILFNTEFQLGADSNRMAYSFENATNLSAKEIITSPVEPGTVQLTPSGKLFVLMRDAQTTGGYARIFQLTEKSINILAQKRPREKVRFKLL